MESTEKAIETFNTEVVEDDISQTDEPIPSVPESTSDSSVEYVIVDEPGNNGISESAFLTCSVAVIFLLSVLVGLGVFSLLSRKFHA